MTTQKALLASRICLQDDLFKEEASPYLFSEHSTGRLKARRPLLTLEESCADETRKEISCALLYLYPFSFLS